MDLDFERWKMPFYRRATKSRCHSEPGCGSAPCELLFPTVALRWLMGSLWTEALAVISERVGYEAVEAFSRVFRRAFDIAPGQYRRAHASPGREGRRRATPSLDHE